LKQNWVSQDSREQPNPDGEAVAPLQLPIDERLVTRIPQQWKRAPEILRWRGPGTFLLLVVREILRPLLYWHAYRIVENDLRQPFPHPVIKESFNGKVYTSEKGLEKVTMEVSALGELTPTEVAARLQRGEAVSVAYSGAQAVGYTWMTQRSGLPLAFDVTWIVHPREAVLYGSFVHPQWRGRGIHTCVDVTVNNYAREHGILRTVASIPMFNSQSWSLARRMGKPELMTVLLVRIRGIKRTWKRTSGAPFSSFFRIGDRE